MIDESLLAIGEEQERKEEIMTVKVIRCSSVPRLEKCPGSYYAGEGIETPDSPEALGGRLAHFALKLWAEAKPTNFSILQDRERMIVHWFSREIEMIEEDHGGRGIRFPELRVGVSFEEVAVRGTLDNFIIPADGTRHLIDYKTGFLPQIPAPENRQLMAYLVCLADTMAEAIPCDCYIFSAGDDAESRFTRTTYDADSLKAARSLLEQIALAAIAEDAPRSPGDHCQYCPALGTERCPETISQVVTSAKAITTFSHQELPVPVQAVEIYTAIKSVERFAKPFLAALKEAIQANPDAWEKHFILKPGAKVRSFSSVEQACARLISQYSIPVDNIWQAVSLSPSKAEGLVIAHNKTLGVNVGSIKSQKGNFAESFSDLIEIEERSPSIARVLED